MKHRVKLTLQRCISETRHYDSKKTDKQSKEKIIAERSFHEIVTEIPRLFDEKPPHLRHADSCTMSHDVCCRLQKTSFLKSSRSSGEMTFGLSLFMAS